MCNKFTILHGLVYYFISFQCTRNSLKVDTFTNILFLRELSTFPSLRKPCDFSVPLFCMEAWAWPTRNESLRETFLVRRFNILMDIMSHIVLSHLWIAFWSLKVSCIVDCCLCRSRRLLGVEFIWDSSQDVLWIGST